MSKRINIHADDIPAHANPIPAATVIGNLLVTSAISGMDVETSTFSPDKDAQMGMAFRHLRRILELADFSLDDVAKLTLYFADPADRSFANRHWLDMFPDEHSRPARQALKGELPKGCFLHIDCIAMKG
ncbi:MAG: RidA family protein [Hyphomicrobiales bacterium]|nr:RidA family protein [Hyphomicrobiales bacterium]